MEFARQSMNTSKYSNHNLKDAILFTTNINTNNDNNNSSSIVSNNNEFPITALKIEEYETIIHPASEALTHNTHNNKNDDNNVIFMDLPPFWNPIKFGGSKGLRNYLGNYGQRLMTKNEALSIGSQIPITTPNNNDEKELMLETIYVSIASYRDWQCPYTVESIFNRAKYPQRIRVGVVDQIQNNSDDIPCTTPPKPCSTHPKQALCQYKTQIDVYSMNAKLAVGPVFARHIGHRLYRGEYFVMQCDAHVEFVKHWDVDIIQQWKSANNEMAILSAYLSDIRNSIDSKTGLSLRKTRPIMCKSDYEGGDGPNKHLRHGQQPEGPPLIHGTPTLEPYWAAGFSFGRGHFIINVPYDQHLPMIFQGEEISMGLRGFTYGYDYYTPERSVCFHMYAVGENLKKRRRVSLFWEHAHLYKGSGVKGMTRLNTIIGMNHTYTNNDDDWIQIDIKKYGIGNVRSLQTFFNTYGIHPKEQYVENHLCRFVGRQMQAKFLPFLRKDGMGIDYSRIHYQFKDPAPNEK